MSYDEIPIWSDSSHFELEADMGKHERQDIEQMERSVVRCLNKQSPLITPAHKWYKHLEGFVSYINGNYPKIREARHIGNEYRHEVGDVKLIMEDGAAHYLELKASETFLGRGTLANISQNAITEYALLVPPENGRILSWSEFREQKHFADTVQRLLGLYPAGGTLPLGAKGRLIRDEAKNADVLAESIKSKITAFAKRDKIEYIQYARNFRPNEENIIKFIYCLLNGIHKKNMVRPVMAEISMADIKEKYAGATTLYANLRGGEVIITKSTARMSSLVEGHDRFSFSFPDDSGEVVNTYLVAHHKRSGAQQRLLSFVLHWKNVFQGIETPCINVFLGPYFKD